MLEIFDMEQRSPEWFAVRRGIPTASNFSKVLAQGQGKTRLKYLRDLAGERITGKSTESFTSKAMERGRRMEAEALNFYRVVTSGTVRKVGFGKNYGAGASPDALVDDDGMVEIKTAEPSVLIPILESGRTPSEHVAQLQGNLWVFEREWIDLEIYWPDMQTFDVRVLRDDRYIDGTLAPGMRRFIDDLEELVERLGGRNIPAPAQPTPVVDLTTAPPAF